MKIVSFNINGLRAREHQLAAIKEQLDPDVIGLQETKVHDDDFPFEMAETYGYHAEAFGQKGHYGVALLSKKPPLEIKRGYLKDDKDAQRRLITGTYRNDEDKEITVINGYFPQGENRNHETKFPYKRKFYTDMMTHLDQFSPEQHLCVIGDMNISGTDQDVGIGEANAKRWLRTGKCSFLPEERQWMDRLMNWGLYDTFREQNPDEDNIFTWFDYRSKGFDDDPKRGLRIDLILASKALQSRLIDSGVDYRIRGMLKPSDHCPIWARFDL